MVYKMNRRMSVMDFLLLLNQLRRQLRFLDMSIICHVNLPSQNFRISLLGGFFFELFTLQSLPPTLGPLVMFTFFALSVFRLHFQTGLDWDLSSLFLNIQFYFFDFSDCYFGRFRVGKDFDC